MFYSLCRLGLIIAVGLTLSFGVHAQSGDQLEKRMQLLNLLDQLDEDDFDRSLNAANNCIAVRDFSCARFNLKNAETYSLTPEHDEQLYAAQRSLGAAIEYVRQEQELALRMAEEEKARERERRAFEEEMERERERERERIAREAEEAEYYDNQADDSNSGWNTVLAISNAYVDTMREQNNRRAEQILAQQRAQQAFEARERDRQAEQERQFQQRQRERQRRMDEIESQLKARQDAFAARQQEERRRAEEQRAQQLRASSQASSTTSAGYSSSGRSNNGPQYTGKLYEPIPVRITGRADSGFPTRDRAVSQARLAAVNDIRAECRARGARSDGPYFEDISKGIAPPRWSYAAPDCRQGGWKGEEWYCTATVSGTCYRNQ